VDEYGKNVSERDRREDEMYERNSSERRPEDDEAPAREDAEPGDRKRTCVPCYSDAFSRNSCCAPQAANVLRFTGANRDAMKYRTRDARTQRFASGATAELAAGWT
jgi:hypothetical protein